MAITDGTQFGKVGAFKFWCQKVLPAVYDDSLSYYELLCKVTHWLEELTETTNTQSDAISELQQTMQDFLDGEITPYIEAVIDAWFEENEPTIMAAIGDLQDRVSAVEEDVEKLMNKSLRDMNIVIISDSYGRGVGANDNNGFPYYINNIIDPNYLLNISNSGAGFITSGHSSGLENLNFQGQIDYAYSHLASGIYADDIDIVIIAGGYNDHAQSGQYSAAYTTFEYAHSKFPNARLIFYPLCAGDRKLDASFVYNYTELSWGSAKGGAEVHPESLYWLYPYAITSSYGDSIHPNETGYRYIGELICGTLYGGNWLASASTLAASGEGFSFATGVTSVDFRAGVQSGYAFYGGSVKKIGDGELFTLPSYCRPPITCYILCFYYADSDHHGIFRCRILNDGRFEAYIPETGTFDNTLEYTYWIPGTVLPLGNLLG